MKADMWAVTSLSLYFLIEYIASYCYASVAASVPLLSVLVVLFTIKHF